MRPFALVDVFADAPLQGNPLAVVGDADGVPEERMRAAAREFQQSETTFVLSPRGSRATARLRSFTPAGDEVVGAGHNALGAWWWIAATQFSGREGERVTVHQELGNNLLPVVVAFGPHGPSRIVLEQAAPEFGATAEPARLAEALALPRGNLWDAAPRVVSTGAAHLMVRLVDRAAVDRAEPDGRRLADVLAAAGAQGCYVYALDDPDASGRDAVSAYARFFNPAVGIWEDPGTGSAAGPLACLLQQQGVAADASTITVLQGVRLGRPSTLTVRLDGNRVSLEARCVSVVEGQVHV